MATTPQNFAPTNLIFTQSQATAALATWVFRAVNSADSTNATGKTFTMTLSKAGGAFAAPNGGTAITELTNGWYKVVHNAADLDTLGTLGVHLTASGVDIIATVHEVRAFDLNTATVNVGSGGIDAGDFTSAALAAISVPLKTVVSTFTLTADGDTAISMAGAIDATVEATGTFGSGTVQMQTTEDPTAGSPVWTARGSGITTSNAASPLVVTGPHNAIRAHLTGSTTPSIQLKITQRKPAV